ncbi:hypothetical protein ACH5RR_028404 [Cinchona calisaya]|uniref:Phorbol-ester/DAG-type domain-containing protein n=1 Tax=Cinchona calisaya TaxID=153742 RepID=A0ABD2YPY3_9GENT
MESINYFSHPEHTLRRKVLFNRDHTTCEMCLKHLFSEVIHSCERGACLFWLHKRCAEFPQKVRYPFHSNHTLTLYKMSQNKKCSLCDDSFKCYGYQCSECDYILDLPCAALTPHNNCSVPGLRVNHQHPLILCYKPQDYKYNCFFCGDPFEILQPVYFSLEYKRLMHESCSTMPNVIKHPFHLEHSLTFLPPTEWHDYNRYCSLCHKVMQSSYHCSLCGFNGFYLDLECAKLVPTSKDYDHSNHGYIKIQLGSHPHPLIQCDGIKNFKHVLWLRTTI